MAKQQKQSEKKFENAFKGNKSGARGRGRRKPGFTTTAENPEPHNFQDEAEEREFQKGEKFGRRIAEHKANDPQWYFKSPQILKDVASFSFAKPLGTRLGVNRIFTDSHYKISQRFTAAPGLLAYYLGIAPGIAQNAQDPVNLAATNVYSFVRHENSGSRNYDAPDLMLYILAMDSIYTAWNWLKRVYGVASTYSQQNRYMPSAYFEAENIDFDDVIANLANFRGFLNVKASEIAAFCVPATMSLNVRHSWLFSNIFEDSNTHKAQQYMYIPSYFFKYEETASAKGGQLTPLTIPNGGLAAKQATKLKVADLEQILIDLLEAVQYSEDIGIMSGDILKAYGSQGLFTLSTIDPAYKVEPAYSQEVLTQFENAITTHFSAADAATFTITQDPDTNWLLFQPSTSSDANVGMDGRFVNFHWDSPTPEDVIVATRLSTVLGEKSGSTAPVLSCGSEILTAAYMLYIAEGSAGAVEYTGLAPLSIYMYSLQWTVLFSDYVATDGGLFAPVMLESFDWHPMYLVTFNTGTVSSPGQSWIEYCAFDFDNYTVITPENIEAMNSMALLSEMNVPN